jgi:hypothetical protein
MAVEKHHGKASYSKDMRDLESIKIHFCTLFDIHYLSRGLALLNSLNACCTNFTLYILCLDDKTYQTLHKLVLKNTVLLELSALEKDNSALLACKNNRSLIEYYFTISPCLPLYILEKVNPSIVFICSLDADLYFFQDPSVIFNDFRNFSILITEHFFHKEIAYRHLENYGQYNVSFQAFKNDDTGKACLKKWREQCLDWCHDYLDEKNQRYADQLYLDEWLTLYPNKVKVIRPNTEGVAPWNINRCALSLKNENLYSNEEPLIYYHFHGLRFLDNNWIATSLFAYKTIITDTLKNHLYLPYILELKRLNHQFNDSSKDTAIRYNFSSVLNHLKLIKHVSVFYLTKKSTILSFNFSLLYNVARNIKQGIVKVKQVLCIL